MLVELNEKLIDLEENELIDDYGLCCRSKRKEKQRREGHGFVLN
jgi:hypothetical protein